MELENAFKMIAGILAQLKLSIAEHNEVQKAFELIKKAAEKAKEG